MYFIIMALCYVFLRPWSFIAFWLALTLFFPTVLLSAVVLEHYTSLKMLLLHSVFPNSQFLMGHWGKALKGRMRVAETKSQRSWAQAQRRYLFFYTCGRIQRELLLYIKLHFFSDPAAYIDVQLNSPACSNFFHIFYSKGTSKHKEWTN